MKRKKIVTAITIFNLLLFICGVVCFGLTARNNRLINTARTDMAYREEKNAVVVCIAGNEVRLRFGEYAVTVEDSYKLKSRAEQLALLSFIREYVAENSILLGRDITDLLGELRLHNLLYSIGFARARTRDADLDYGSDRRWYVSAASKIIGVTGL